MVGSAQRLALAAGLLCPVLIAAPGATLGIVWIEEESLHPATRVETWREVGQLFREADFKVEWAKPEEVAGLTAFAKLVVVRVCAPVEEPGGVRVTGGGRPLGSTQVVNQRILPFIRIYPERVEGLVGRSTLSSQPLHRRLLIGRALGRILAHELYHVLAETLDHGNRGVTQSHLGVEELVWTNLGFEAHELRRMSERSLPGISRASR
jgi:hypothetical protein